MATSDENTIKLGSQLEKLADKVDEKFEKISDRLGSIDSTLAAQHESLKDHIRRTELLEQEVKPIKAHVDGLKGVTKFLKILAVVASIAEALRIFKVF